MAYIGFEPVNTFSPVPSKDSFTGDGSTVAFDVQNEVVFGGENALEVFVDNVRQEPGAGKAFTLNLDGNLKNKRITFSAAPASGAVIYVINDKTSSTSTISPKDLNGVEFILDADADTSITADTDDRIDFKLANVDHINIGTSSGDTVISQMTDAKDIIFKQFDGNKILEINDGNFVGIGGNDTAAGEIRIFEDTDNGTNYSGFTVGNLTASVAYQLPNADGSSGTQLTTNGSGVLSWAAAEIALANDGNNRIVTGTGSASLNAEANLTFDGSTLALTGAATVSSTLAVSGVTTSNAGVVVDNITIDGTEIDLSSGDLLVDVAGDITLDAGGGDWLFNVATTNILKISNSSSDVIIKPIVDAKDIIFQQRDGTEVARIEDNATFNVSTAGKFAYAGVAVTATAAELNILDDATITTTELNLLDGGTSASSVTLADADRIIVNDGGTMKQVAISALNTYTSASIAADDVTIGDGAVLISTSSGNIVIDAAANDSDIILKGTDGGGDTTFLTIDGSAAGAAAFNSTVTATGFIIGSASVNEAQLEILDGATVTTTELNLIDGGATVGTTAIADGDGLLINDAGTMRVSTVQTLAAYLDDEITSMPNLTTAAALVTVSALGAGSIAAGFGAIDNGTSGIRSNTITAETAFVPDASGGADLGTTALEFNDAFFNDGAVINFGDDQDTTLTHTDGTGLTLNSTNKLCFNDASQYIQGASNAILDIAATDEIELTATLIEIVGNSTVSGTLGVTGVTTSNAGVVVDEMTLDADTLTATDDFIVDAAGDITLDAGGGNVKVSVGGTQILDIANSSSDVIIKPVVDAKDIIFQQRDGTEVMRVEDGAHVSFAAAAVNPEATLSDGANVAWNTLTSPVAKLTLGGNRALSAGSGGVTGQFVSLLVIQDGTGSRTLTFNGVYEFAANTAPTLTTTANLGDLFVFRYNGAKYLEVGRNLALVLS